MPRLQHLQAWLQRCWPGLLVCATVALAARFMANHYSSPVMLMALLLGMAMNFLSTQGACQHGIEVTARQVLRTGVALLGLRITFDQVSALGWPPVLIVVGAMVVYPLLAQWLNLTELQAGFFIGATIHDVAQVVGAGYSISKDAGDTATLVKLMRVAMLLPVIMLVGWVTARHLASQDPPQTARQRPPLLPGFAVAFALLMVLNSLHWLPVSVVQAGKTASQWCLVAAMVAIGMKTHLKDMLDVGWKPIVLMAAETIGLALFVYAVL